MAAVTGSGRNNPWLDLIRGLAIVLVLLRHGERALPTGTGGHGRLETIFINGWVGVDLFFVLSGYLIASHLVRAGVGSGHFRLGRYLAMRALRIVPAYVAVLALILLGAFPLYRISPDGLPFRLVYHLLFLQDYLPSDINVAFWSLGVEEKFYLLAPLLVFWLLLRRSGGQQTAALAVLFLLPLAFRALLFLRLPEAVEYDAYFRIFRSPFHVALDGLAAGVAIAVAQHAGLVRQSSRAGMTVLALSAAAFFIWLASDDFMADIGWFDATVQPSMIAVLAGAMTLGAVQLAGTPMPLARPLNLLARLSYCLYLVHFPLLPVTMALTASRDPADFWACYFMLTFAAALLLHLGVEKPFLVWKDRIAAGREGAPQELPVAPAV